VIDLRVFILDTNVVSAVMLPRPPTEVIEWLDARESSTLFLSSVTIGEIAFGLNVLPSGRRRRALERRFALFVQHGFDQRVLPYDALAAEAYGRLTAERRVLGRPIAMADGQIAAIAAATGLAVVTRNVRDFDACGIAVVDPFAVR